MTDRGWFVPRHARPAAPASEAGGAWSAAEADDGDAYVRPFIMTGGRTTPVTDGLRLETLVRALPAALSAPLAFEARRVVERCQQPCSVAEIATALGVPVGVARVVIGDLLAGNLVFRLESPEPGSMPLHTIERIRDLVRAL
ncbi:DUF742 domain-containing protein [Yinghuangia seranimata]|uniref:DUF742 domain-containing protein n=1 Tax=Yinghuangia seranimata TaxID=408067 RepID=UPI00248BC684|nr:DUF742 domain-containing protein [Yinghuangia seranimata]MDI2130417.1 DUF742 domain-containing protein [Yinghuangia seranimata]